MRVNYNKKIPSWLLCTMLIVAMAFTTGGCGTKDKGGSQQPSSETQGASESGSRVLGEGQTQFQFVVVDKDGTESNFEIHTDKTTVGEALLELDLITGDEGEFGLYVKTVNGITADYDTDQTYWAFYVKGEYATAGVDTTTIEEGATYSFKREK